MPDNFISGQIDIWNRLSKQTQKHIHKNLTTEYDNDGMEVPNDDAGSASASVSRRNSDD